MVILMIIFNYTEYNNLGLNVRGKVLLLISSLIIIIIISRNFNLICYKYNVM